MPEEQGRYQTQQPQQNKLAAGAQSARGPADERKLVIVGAQCRAEEHDTRGKQDRAPGVAIDRQGERTGEAKCDARKQQSAEGWSAGFPQVGGWTLDAHLLAKTRPPEEGQVRVSEKERQQKRRRADCQRDRHEPLRSSLCTSVSVAPSATPPRR